ncbi:MAG: fatty acid desaturase family protein [Myxococcota bacterium]
MHVALPSVRALALEAAVAWGTLALVVAVWHPALTVLGMLVIATRQHALFILYHDAVHGLIARPRRLNDLLINVFVGIPQLLPIHVYRALHLVHHQHLGTERDPERLLLYAGQPWAYAPLPPRTLVRQLLGDLLVWNNLATGLRYLRERLAPTGRLRLPPAVVYPEFFLLAAGFWGVVALGAWSNPEVAARAAFVWVVPLLTLTQAIQKVRSFAEHGANGLSYSWAPGWLGRLVLWPYHISYHREHHARPDVPWFELPAAFPDRDARPGYTLPALLVADPDRRS